MDQIKDAELAIGLGVRLGGKAIPAKEFFADLKTQERRREEERAVADQARNLIRAVELSVHEGVRKHPANTSVEIRRLTRAECTHDILYALHMIAPPLLTFTPGEDLRGREGPLKVNGVSCYPVHNLPEPGWRIIGPGTSDG